MRWLYEKSEAYRNMLADVLQKMQSLLKPQNEGI